MTQKKHWILFVSGCVSVSLAQVAPSKTTVSEYRMEISDTLYLDSIRSLQDELQYELKRAINETPYE